jgi:single-strand DNA-binding protein
MANLNLAQVIGYLGEDATRTVLSNKDIKYTFSIATSDKWKDKMTGEQRSNTEWHKIETIVKSTVGEGLHTFYKNILRKGKATWVSGKMRSSKYELEGVARVKHYIEVNRMAGGDIQPLEARKDSTDSPFKSAEETQNAHDDDISF